MALSQDTDFSWSAPLNLSQSGGASNPLIVVDEVGLSHVFWLDQHAGYYYRAGDGEAWTEPVQIDPPFDPYAPTLVLGANNRVHAVWIDEVGDLYFSRGTLDQLSLSSAWESPRFIAASVIRYAVEVDSQGNIQLLYLRNEQADGLPAGVYAQNSGDNGASWTSAQVLFQSPYLRGLAAGNASVDLDSTVLGEGSWVYAAWDNRIRKQISLVRSITGGRTWDEPIMIDGPEYGSASVIPYNMRVAASGEDVLLVWQRGQLGARCSLHYMYSNDGGNSWSTRYRMLEEMQGCPTETSFLPLEGDFFVFQISFPDYVSLLAWDGRQWSEPQSQRSIAEFEDPDTYNLLDFSCRQFGVNPLTGRLVLVGCDTIGAGDIWMTERDLGDILAWYPPAPTWTQPLLVASPPDEVIDPLLVAGPGDLLHAMWSQPGKVAGTASNATRIYYARRFEQSWSQAVEVLGSAQGVTGGLDAAIDSAGRLFAVWSEGDAYQGLFSWAGATQAYRISDWTAARELPSPVISGSNPDIQSFGQDNLFVAYAVPLNEARGIYLTHSEDVGTTWSAPLPVFDAVEAGWDMVDHPQLAIASDGTLHVLFTRFSLPGGRGALGVYYIRSDDGGNTWTAAQPVVEGSVYWSRILVAEDGILHRIWQVEDITSNKRIIQHQYSLDGGITWSSLVLISTLHLAGPTDVDVDSAGRLHLLMSVTYITGDLGLEHWVWTGGDWVLDSSLSFQNEEVIEVDSISIAVTPDNRLGALYSAKYLEDNSNLAADASSLPQVISFIAFTSRSLDEAALPAYVPLPLVSQTPTVSPEPATTETAVPADETIQEATVEETSLQPSPEPGGNSWMGIGLGAGLAVVLVLVSFGVIARRMERR